MTKINTKRTYHTFRILDGAHQAAKVAAAKAGLTVGQWLEAAIADRAKKDEEDRLDKILAQFERKHKIG